MERVVVVLHGRRVARGPPRRLSHRLLRRHRPLGPLGPRRRERSVKTQRFELALVALDVPKPLQLVRRQGFLRRQRRSTERLSGRSGTLVEGAWVCGHRRSAVSRGQGGASARPAPGECREAARSDGEALERKSRRGGRRGVVAGSSRVLTTPVTGSDDPP